MLTQENKRLSENVERATHFIDQAKEEAENMRTENNRLLHQGYQVRFGSRLHTQNDATAMDCNSILDSRPAESRR